MPDKAGRESIAICWSRASGWEQPSWSNDAESGARVSEDEAAMHLSPEKAHYTLFPSIILRSILLFTLKSLAEAIKYYYVKHLQQKKKKPSESYATCQVLIFSLVMQGEAMKEVGALAKVNSSFAFRSRGSQGNHIWIFASSSKSLSINSENRIKREKVTGKTITWKYIRQ